MASGEIVFASRPITLDADAVADTAVTQAFATAIFPIATYALIHTTIIPPRGTQTKGILVVVAQSIT